MPRVNSSFSPKAFKYFESARRNRKNKLWFDKHRQEYQDVVREPFEALTRLLAENFSSELPKIDFLSRKISRPVRRNPDDDGGILRSNAMAYFAEKPTSQFEWNPGIYLSIGAKPEDNVFGVGLYMVSSRQMSGLRNGIVNEFEEIDSLLSAKRLVSKWGHLGGEVYKRFPKGFDEDSPPAKYIRHKQFFLGQELTKKRVCQKNFFKTVVSDLERCLPFLHWVRSTVGVYSRRRDLD